ncbi:hypothetical protein LSH36_1g12015 [Paralvinella palmiformis]|uniref:Phospholipase B1, membrane-associated n=1 Tax=Paralvinella palmiformis TaxID=53620 RepID=A0AAD9NJC2_9ANNE|nr:hypothetical protein LSH36_1g12015 [Paralvinella palmiformis]
MWAKILLVFALVSLETGELVPARVSSPKKADEFRAKVIQFAYEVSTDPELKNLWDKSAYDPWMPEMPQFQCDTSQQYGPSTSVHRLRPSDVKVLAAMGDSISAGNGVGAERLLAVALENRGESWDIGGDFSLEEGVITLTTVFQKYTPDLKGKSVCVSQETNEKKSWLNVAEPGGDSSDMPYQAQLIVDRCKRDERIDINNDWKMVTLFIGGNDFCGSCDFSQPDFIDPNHTPEVYRQKIEEALDILHTKLPKTFVNLVPMFDITPLNNFTDPLCTLSHWLFCDCVVVNATEMKPLQLGYYNELKSLIDSGKYETKDDFTVVIQPMFVDSDLPVDPETGEYIRTFLSPDCFHPGRGAHQSFALTLWNTMFIPVGQKPQNVKQLEYKWYCPTESKAAQNEPVPLGAMLTKGAVVTIYLRSLGPWRSMNSKWRSMLKREVTRLVINSPCPNYDYRAILPRMSYSVLQQ